MASITAPQPILQKQGYAGDGIEENLAGDNSKGRMKRDTIGGQLKFWSGNGQCGIDNWFDTEKDMGEWGEQKFNQDSSADPLNRSPHRKALAFFALCLGFSIVGMQRLMSFGEFLGGRIFEGLGWGAFEGLIRGAVGDMYYESQIPAHMRILSIIDLVFTWGTPIIGGYLSQTVDGYGNQIMVMNIAQAISIFFLIIVFPRNSLQQIYSPYSFHTSSTNQIF
ncbi:hypothetical protein DID88_010359 [Monilinia fructigena]|uniref:Major facilitator superfamily (MFS) profile domain-containing protein n=1 Tax=Monilinia fructigena TaxID=38457 RepID=A0A395ILY1_9HELO|nr:hypothetical protein DID88_010359 [Monilinia fructigena]